MKFREIRQLNLEDVYWRLVFGSSKEKASFFELRANGFRGLPAPVFFLSTGRCGTNWFTMLLSGDKTLKVFHEPRPNFGVQGKVAYELYSRRDFKVTPDEDTLLKEIFLTGREQYLRYSFKTQRRLVETNNQVTFLAPAIFRLFPETKFVHLNRHPGEFVRSALRRRFYSNTDDIKRIVPAEGDPYFSSWDSMSSMEKCGWLWKATNGFIEKFKSAIPGENQFYFDFSELNKDNINRLCSFLNVHIAERRTGKLLGQPVNVQKSGDVERYGRWTEAEKVSLKKVCGELASVYNYQL